MTAYRDANLSLPTRKTGGSAGYDIAAADNVRLYAGQVSLIPTGLKAFMPADEYLGIFIRSGLSIRNCLSLINGQGIIDADYYNNPGNEGHIIIAVFNHGREAVDIAKGVRVAQGIFQRYFTTAEETETEGMVIRTGGFGSTGE